MSAYNRSFMNMLIGFFLIILLSTFAGSVSAVEKVTYYHNDALGSPVAATDAQGSLLWEESYEPYGKRLLKEDAGKEEVWFTGKQEESDFDVSYFGARWYDPSIGRFLAIDPAGVSSSNIHSFNRYTYANNNPYKFVDPDGREIELVGTEAQKTAFKNILSVLKGSNSTTRSQVVELEKSSNVHTLRFPKPGEAPGNATTGTRANESNRVGTGSETIADPTKAYTITDRTGSKLTVSAASVVAHELLGHGLDKDRGVIDRSINPDTGQRRSEESAMSRANTFRKSVGETERKKY